MIISYWNILWKRHATFLTLFSSRSHENKLLLRNADYDLITKDWTFASEFFVR